MIDHVEGCGTRVLGHSSLCFSWPRFTRCKCGRPDPPYLRCKRSMRQRQNYIFLEHRSPDATASLWACTRCRRSTLAATRLSRCELESTTSGVHIHHIFFFLIANVQDTLRSLYANAQGTLRARVSTSSSSNYLCTVYTLFILNFRIRSTASCLRSTTCCLNDTILSNLQTKFIVSFSPRGRRMLYSLKATDSFVGVVQCVSIVAMFIQLNKSRSASLSSDRYQHRQSNLVPVIYLNANAPSLRHSKGQRDRETMSDPREWIVR